MGNRIHLPGQQPPPPPPRGPSEEQKFRALVLAMLDTLSGELGRFDQTTHGLIVPECTITDVNRYLLIAWYRGTAYNISNVSQCIRSFLNVCGGEPTTPTTIESQDCTTLSGTDQFREVVIESLIALKVHLGSFLQTTHTTMHRPTNPNTILAGIGKCWDQVSHFTLSEISQGIARLVRHYREPPRDTSPLVTGNHEVERSDPLVLPPMKSDREPSHDALEVDPRPGK